jgi:hypothetical protein
MARSKAALKAVESEPIDYTMELERLFADAKDEKDFSILIRQRLPKLTREQYAIIDTLAVSFYRNGRGRAPVLEKTVLKPKQNAIEKLQAKMARDARALAALAEAKVEVERRFLMTIPHDMTMHELWVQGGSARKLGRNGDQTLVSDNYTKGQLAKADICFLE